MSGLLISLASTPAPVEGQLTKVIMALMIGMGLILMLVFAAKVKSEWSR